MRKPYFDDSELYFILDAMKRYKKECIEMYKNNISTKVEKDEVIGEMDDIIESIESYIEKDTKETNAFRNLLSENKKLAKPCK